MKPWFARCATLATACLLGLSHCTFLLPRGSVQCSSDQECTDRGFAGSVCSSEGICMGVPRCQKNADCNIKPGFEDRICVKASGTCTALSSEDCKSFLGDPKDDDAVVFGFLGQLSGSESVSGEEEKRALTLVQQEFQQGSAGIPGVAGGRSRPLAFVICSDANDAVRAARHLAQDLRVPAIVGPYRSGDAIKIVQQVTKTARVLLISPSATAAAITALDDDGLLWRTSPSDNQQLIALQSQISNLEASYKKSTPPPTAPFRVAVAFRNDTYGSGLNTGLAGLETLKLNDKSIPQNLSDKNFITQGYPAEAIDRDFEDLVANLGSINPNVVLLFGTVEIVNGVIPRMEKRTWPNNLKPHYILTDGGKDPVLKGLVKNNPDLRKRIRGTAPGRDSPAAGQFAFRYNSLFGGFPTAFGTSNAYDAGYLLAYAAAAAGKRPLDGFAIRDGLQRMSQGKAINAGPTDINAAFAELKNEGATIDFAGVSGPLNFDPATGEAGADISVWCLSGDADPTFADTGTFLDATATPPKMVGEYKCP